MSGAEVRIEGVSKSLGGVTIFRDLTFTMPPGEISVLLGPSGTGKTVFLRCLMGLLKPDEGAIYVGDTNIVELDEEEMNEVRKQFGVVFQDGALFGSMDIFDNVAFPLREHTSTPEDEIDDIVKEKLNMVGLAEAVDKLPGEISGGMKKRAGLARGLVLEPGVMLFDEPDSGLDPVRVAYLNQLIVDLNAKTDSTFLIISHDIRTAQTLPDNIGIMYNEKLAMFGTREEVLTSKEPVVAQFLHGRRHGPIAMDESTDESEQSEEERSTDADLPPLQPQIQPSDGQERKAVARRWERVRKILDDLPEEAQQQIRETDPERDGAGSGDDGGDQARRGEGEHDDAEHGDAEHDDAEHADAEHDDAEHANAEHDDAEHADAGAGSR
jgi:phospholipid/cholesterol/gamma-HCH transport system ATP-binding protein